MRYFVLHIFVKDFLFLFIYLLIMKFNLTHETFLPDTIRSFPGASRTAISDILLASIIYNLIPFFFSLVSYFPIFWIIKRFIKNKKFRLLITGFILTSTTLILYFVLNGYNPNFIHLKKAEILSWILTYSISMILYYKLNFQSDTIFKTE